VSVDWMGQGPSILKGLDMMPVWIRHHMSNYHHDTRPGNVLQLLSYYTDIETQAHVSSAQHSHRHRQPPKSSSIPALPPSQPRPPIALHPPLTADHPPLASPTPKSPDHCLSTPPTAPLLPQTSPQRPSPAHPAIHHYVQLAPLPSTKTSSGS